MTDIKKLLIVDNHPFSLETTHRLEKEFSLRIDYASTAEEGLLKVDDVNFVVSNFDLPGMNGVEFLLKAKRVTPGLKFALLTGKEEEGAKDSELIFIVSNLFFGIENEDPLGFTKGVAKGVTARTTADTSTGDVTPDVKVDSTAISISKSEEPSESNEKREFSPSPYESELLIV